MGYIYRFKNKNNEIIYIGQTTQEDLNYRLSSHSHLPKECYKEIANIEYANFTNYRNNYYGCDIEDAEKYFICKYKPKYNIIYKRINNEYVINKLDNIYWKQYKDGDPTIWWLPEKVKSNIKIEEMKVRCIEHENENINKIRLGIIYKIFDMQSKCNNIIRWHFGCNYCNSRNEFKISNIEQTDLKCSKCGSIYCNLSKAIVKIIKDAEDYEKSKILENFSDIDKRYAYVVSIDEKYAPCVSLYCLNTGKIQDVKIYKKDFANNKFKIGDVIYCEKFSHEPSKKLVNDEWIESKTEKTWWLKKWHLADSNLK